MPPPTRGGRTSRSFRTHGAARPRSRRACPEGQRKPEGCVYPAYLQTAYLTRPGQDPDDDDDDDGRDRGNGNGNGGNGNGNGNGGDADDIERARQRWASIREQDLAAGFGDDPGLAIRRRAAPHRAHAHGGDKAGERRR